MRDGVLRILVPRAPEAQAGLIRLLARQEGTAGMPAGALGGEPAGLLIAVSATGQRTDLVTIPPQAGERDAAAAMEQAARAGNRDRAPVIVAAVQAAAARGAGDPAGLAQSG